MLEMSDKPANFSLILGIPEPEFRLVFGRTKINYDPLKDLKNREKHNYSLDSAVWLLEKLLLPIAENRQHVISESFVKNEEVRHKHMCVDDSGNVVFMVTTMREDETVQIISLRRAHETERAIFHDLTGYASARKDVSPR